MLFESVAKNNPLSSKEERAGAVALVEARMHVREAIAAAERAGIKQQFLAGELIVHGIANAYDVDPVKIRPIMPELVESIRSEMIAAGLVKKERP
jgi:hypothetical protein